MPILHWIEQFQAFGKAEEKISQIRNPLRFPGQYFDEESGLHYNFHRYYLPELGRYLNKDPIRLQGGINEFGYGIPNPIKFYDFLGLATYTNFPTSKEADMRWAEALIRLKLKDTSCGCPCAGCENSKKILEALDSVEFVYVTNSPIEADGACASTAIEWLWGSAWLAYYGFFQNNGQIEIYPSTWNLECFNTPCIMIHELVHYTLLTDHDEEGDKLISEIEEKCFDCINKKLEEWESLGY